MSLRRSGHGSPRPGAQRALVVLAEGPFTAGPDGCLTATVSVPLERLELGPVGARLAVATSGSPSMRAEPGRPWKSIDRVAALDLAALLRDREFVAQHCYAIAAATLQLFEAMLGRRVPWRGDRQRLVLFPFATVTAAETGYDCSSGVIRFGRLRASRGHGAVPLALFHDLVAHEVTHAIVDGYRPSFSDGDGPSDQRALHEAWADLVAMLSVFSSPERVEQALAAADQELPAARSQRAAWLAQSVLFGVADGLWTRKERALRRSVLARPGSWQGVDEPHARGEVIVWAVMQTVLQVWLRRLALPEGTSSLYRIAEEGAKAGRHVLGMVVRGLGYTPPVDVTFDDMVRGMLVADTVMVPEDTLGYRRMLRQTFAQIGVHAARAPRLGRLAGLRYPVHSIGLHADAEAIHRFLWEHPDLLELARVDPSMPLGTCRIRPTQRVGPDGFVVSEVALSFLQRRPLTATAARRLTGDSSAGPIELVGGGLLRFDESGQLSFASLKPVLDPHRQPWRWKLQPSLADTKNMGLRADFFQNLHR